VNHNTITKWLIKYASLSFVIISILLFGILAKYGTDISVNIAHVLVIAFMATTVVGTILGALFRFNKAFRSEHDIYNSVGMCTGILISTLTLVSIVPSNRPRESAYRASCANNLSQLYKAMLIYRSTFGNNVDYMPHHGQAFFKCLLGHGEPHPSSYEQKAPCCGNKELFICPSGGTIIESVVADGNMPDYLGPKKHTPNGTPSALDDSVPANTPIAADKKHNHTAGGNVLFFDGTVRFLIGVEYEMALNELE
jgi:prepilin-type processing-associated H-X9-DG protein